MGELMQAVKYAVVNGVTATSIYSGSAIFFGESVQPAMISGAAAGMIVFGTYLIREKEQVNPGIQELMPTPNTNKQKIKDWTPRCVKRYGLMRILI